MNEIDYESPLEALAASEWEQLTPTEKALMIVYRAHLNRNTPISMIRKLMIKINEIHAKYRDLNIGSVP